MAISEKMKGILDQSVEVSKKIANKAGSKAQDLGEKGYRASKSLVNKAGVKAQEMGEQGLLLLEIKKLEGQKRKLINKLGHEVCNIFIEKGTKTISGDSPALKPILLEIVSINETIEKRETELKNRRK